MQKYDYKESGVPPVRFYLHSRKYHLETDLLEQLVEGMHVRGGGDVA